MVDAACPLVTKAHRELVARAVARDRIVHLGRPGHEETQGVLGVVEGTELVEGLPESSVVAGDAGRLVQELSLAPRRAGRCGPGRRARLIGPGEVAASRTFRTNR